MSDYAIVNPDDARDSYAGTDVAGEFRGLTERAPCSTASRAPRLAHAQVT